MHLVNYMKFEGFSIGNFYVEKTSQSGNWIWGVVSKVNSEGIILKSLSILSPIKEQKLKESKDSSDKMKIEGGIKVGDVIGWHRSRDASIGYYTAVIKINIEATTVTCVDFNEKSSILAVGCKNGYFFCYNIDQNNIGEQSLHLESHNHNKQKVL